MRLGIDFGTCYTSAALMVNKVLKPIKEPLKHNYSFPSSIFVTSEGEILIGEAAENRRQKNSNCYRRNFKRDLNEKIPLIIGEFEFSYDQIIGKILGKLKSEAEIMVNQSLTSVVLTVPAEYQNYKRKIMKKAAYEAGFTQVHLLDEPVAAAIYYNYQNRNSSTLQEGDIILVYDLGGGTFDAALIEKQGNNYQVITQPIGDGFCGGIDFDRQIYNDLKNQFQATLGDLLDSKQVDLQALRFRLFMEDFCKNFKHQLSEEIIYEDMIATAGIFEEYSLSREKFEQMIDPFIAKTIQLCQQLVKNSNLKWNKIDRLLMVGGSSRIPYLKKQLEAKLGIRVVRIDDPELAVCFGAAIASENIPIRENEDDEYYEWLSLKQESNINAKSDLTQNRDLEAKIKEFEAEQQLKAQEKQQQQIEANIKELELRQQEKINKNT